ncbi:MAG: vitamin B12-binding protein, partial [Ligilactobacillus ruminis]|nr:vitamin B12-binding protein [Ligilactobacillus ruminis]
YGQIPKIGVLPVTEGCILRAEFKNRHFARNGGLHFTGRSQKSTFCP